MGDHDNLICVFKDILDYSKNLLKDFEVLFNVEKSQEILKEIPLAEPAYMEAIIVNLSKIFSCSGCDNFGIKQIKEIAAAETTKKLKAIELKEKDIIKKVCANRHRLIVHTDKNYQNMGFSESHIKRLEKIYKTDFSQLRKSGKKDEERYTPQDFKDDIDRIRGLLDDLDKIWEEVLMFNYKKK